MRDKFLGLQIRKKNASKNFGLCAGDLKFLKKKEIYAKLLSFQDFVSFNEAFSF